MRHARQKLFNIHEFINCKSQIKKSEIFYYVKRISGGKRKTGTRSEAQEQKTNYQIEIFGGRCVYRGIYNDDSRLGYPIGGFMADSGLRVFCFVGHNVGGQRLRFFQIAQKEPRI